MKNIIGKSKEEYLKSILIIQKEFGACRAVDVSRKMNVSKSSASIAIKKLAEDGYIVKDDWRVVLTEVGKQIAEAKYDKDQFFYTLFVRIGIHEETAKRDAGMVQSVLSEESYRKIKDYIERK